jgi:hypothetical protein
MDQEELLILNLTMEWVSQVNILLTRNRQLVNQNSPGITRDRNLRLQDISQIAASYGWVPVI